MEPKDFKPTYNYKGITVKVTWGELIKQLVEEPIVTFDQDYDAWLAALAAIEKAMAKSS